MVSPETLINFYNIRSVITLDNVMHYDFKRSHDSVIKDDMYYVAKSKYGLEHGIDVLNESSEDYGIVLILCPGKEVEIEFLDEISNGEKNNKNIKIHSGGFILFPSHLRYVLVSGEPMKHMYKISDFKENGEGLNKYRVSIDLIDTYRIDVRANSESDAIDYAFGIGMHNWIHEWNQDPDLDQYLNLRVTKFGKKNIKAIKI
jgi:hypothetical protein